MKKNESTFQTLAGMPGALQADQDTGPGASLCLV